MPKMSKKLEAKVWKAAIAIDNSNPSTVEVIKTVAKKLGLEPRRVKRIVEKIESEFYDLDGGGM